MPAHYARTLRPHTVTLSLGHLLLEGRDVGSYERAWGVKSGPLKDSCCQRVVTWRVTSGHGELSVRRGRQLLLEGSDMVSQERA